MARIRGSKNKPKQPAKRKYKKSIQSLKESEVVFKEALDDFKPIIEPKKELDELEFLEAVVLGVEQMTSDQKSRFMNYIYSRYWMYITLSKLTQ